MRDTMVMERECVEGRWCFTSFLFISFLLSMLYSSSSWMFLHLLLFCPHFCLIVWPDAKIGRCLLLLEATTTSDDDNDGGPAKRRKLRDWAKCSSNSSNGGVYVYLNGTSNKGRQEGIALLCVQSGRSLQRWNHREQEQLKEDGRPGG